MALRVNTDQQAFFIYEPGGHNVPAMNAAWTILGEVVVHTDVDLPSIIVTRYYDLTPSGWAGSYYAVDGSTHYIYLNPGTGQVSSSPWTMGPGRYSYSIHHNGSGTIQVRVDGVLMVEFAGTVNAGTNGSRSIQWAGFGTPALAGYMDSTWQRWRMWTANLSSLECFAEFRSATPVRTSGLIHDWPMDAGSARLNDTVSGQPDLLDNPALPLGDGTDIPLQTGQRVYFGAAGTSASGTASCTPAYPTGITSTNSDLWLAVTGRSNDAGTAFGVPAGWTLVTDSELEGGTGTWGADTGTRRVALYRKDTVAGTESGTISVTLGGAVTTNNTLRATIFRTERPTGTSLQVVATTGADTTNGTGFSATGSASLAFDVGDLVMVGVAQNIDTGTQSAVSLTASGIGFAPRQNVRSDAVTNGNDHRHILDAFHVMSGTATVAPTYAYTISANGSGPASFLRLRATTGGATDLTVPDLAQSQTLDAVALTLDTTLGVADMLQAQSLDAVVLSTQQQLAPADLAHGHTLDAVTLTTSSATSLVPADMAQSQTLDAVALTLDTHLAPADLAQAHALDAVVLSTLQPLSVADLSQGQTLDAVVLTTTSGATLEPAGMLQGHTLEAIELTTVQPLALADLAHAHALDAIALSTQHLLALSDLAHAHSLDSPAVNTALSLALADLLHIHSLDAVALSSATSLAPADMAQGHALESAVLSSLVVLAMADLLHAHTLDAVTLSTDDSMTLNVADMLHAHTLESPTLVTEVGLTVARLVHAQSLEGVTLGALTALVVADLLHAHSLDAVTLQNVPALQVARLTQAHTLDSVALSALATLVVSDMLHAHRLEGVTLSGDDVDTEKALRVVGRPRRWGITGSPRNWRIQ